ncbi:oligosaccharide flippase family protein [Akkermansiaceae bacterium]|nr:oligosaccharide flippase family protein [Akkermansiaceae bacterium]
MGLGNLVKDFSFYGLIDVLQRTIGVILIPYYTARLSPEEFGNYDICIVLSSFLFIFIDLQIIAGFNRFYHEHGSKTEKQRLIGSVIVIRLLLGAILAIVFLLAGYIGYFEIAYLPSFYNNKISWVIIALFPLSTSLYDALIAQSRMSGNKLAFAFPSLISVLFSSIGAIFLIELYGLGVNGILLALLLGKLSGSLISYIIQSRDITFTLDYDIIKKLLKYTIPLIPGWWLAFFSVYFARFFVYGELGAESNAVLAVTMKILLVVNVFTLSFRTAWYPIAMSYIGNSDSEKFYIASNKIFTLGLLAILFTSTLLIDPIISVFLPESYEVVAVIFPLFITSTVFAELDINLQLGTQLAKKTIWISIGAATYFFLSISIVLNFTNEYKLHAIGFSLLIPSFIKLLLTFISSQYFWHINYSVRTLVAFFLGTSLILLYFYLEYLGLLSDLELNALLIIGGLLSFFLAVRKSDLRRGIFIIKKIKR